MVILLTACSPVASQSVSSTPTEGSLVFYSTATPSLTPNLTLLPTGTLPPTITPTPRIYTVKQGDTLSGIAWAYGINLLELQAANPTVDPLSLKPGMTIVLPEAKPSAGGTQPVPSSTPVPLVIDQPVCYPSLDGSAWCFALAHNTNSYAVENVTAEIRLTVSGSDSELVMPAITPLDVIAAGGAQPLVVHFLTPVGVISKATAVLQTCIPVVNADTRYLATRIDSQEITYLDDGKSATLTGSLLVEGSKPSQLVWIAIIAFDANGKVVGVRRWSSTSALKADTTLPFSIDVYSMAGKITRIDLQVEARP